MTTLNINRWDDLCRRLVALEMYLRQIHLDKDAITIIETLSEIGHLRQTLLDVQAELRELKISLDPPPIVGGRMNARWR